MCVVDAPSIIKRGTYTIRKTLQEAAIPQDDALSTVYDSESVKDDETVYDEDIAVCSDSESDKSAAIVPFHRIA
jgi:hypothetical protein